MSTHTHIHHLFFLQSFSCTNTHKAVSASHVFPFLSELCVCVSLSLIFSALPYLSLTGGLNKITKAAQLCRDFLCWWMACCFYPRNTCISSSSRTCLIIHCSLFHVLFNVVNVFLSSSPSLHVTTSLSSSLAHIHIFSACGSISPLSRLLCFSPYHGFHYSAASIDLLCGWSAIDYNACSTATEYRHHCRTNIILYSTHTPMSLTHASSVLTFSHIHFRTFPNTLDLCFTFSIDIASQ